MAVIDTAEPPSGSFCFVADGEESGPHDFDELGHLIKVGKIKPATLVRISGTQDWRPAGAISAFVGAFCEIAAWQQLPQLQPPPLPAARPTLAQTTDAELASSTIVPDALDLALPQLGANRRISMSDVRDPKEAVYLAVIWVVNILIGVLLLMATPEQPGVTLGVVSIAILVVLLDWISSKLFQASVLGNCVEVSADQYPQISSVVRQASQFLSLPTPRIFVIQGHGLFELFVAKRFMRNGMVIVTSNMLDEYTRRADSREFMMFVGRQLGHIKAGHFRWWFFKDVIGRLALFFHSAWWRHCHITADRIGLLCAGDLYAAEQALLMITVGPGVASGTNFAPILRQREQIGSSFWAWLNKIFSTYPFMIVRLVRLREFAGSLGMQLEKPNAANGLGVLPIHHVPLRSVPVLIIHGHDRLAMLELQNLLLTRFPNVVPRLMVAHQHGTLGMPEKFDRVAADVWGAIALITPDDKGSSASEVSLEAMRARQNVVMEVGWAWGKLGRHKCLLLKRGDVEMPSDLAGADVETFQKTPSECIATVYAFIEHLTRDGMSGR